MARAHPRQPLDSSTDLNQSAVALSFHGTEDSLLPYWLIRSGGLDLGPFVMPHDPSNDGLVTSTLIAVTKIGDYFVTVEEGLATAKEDGLAQINAFLGESSSAETFLQTISTRFDNDLSRAFRYSAVILLYTTFESRSRLFREIYETKYGHAPKCPNKRCSFVSGLQYSLTNHSRPVNIDRPKLWEQLSDINIVRNSIAHAAGLLRHSSRKPDLERIVSSSPDLALDLDDYLVVGPAFPFRICDIIYIFFSLLFNSAGFQMHIPEEAAEQLAKQFRGFEDQIETSINEYYSKKGI